MFDLKPHWDILEGQLIAQSRLTGSISFSRMRSKTKSTRSVKIRLSCKKRLVLSSLVRTHSGGLGDFVSRDIFKSRSMSYIPRAPLPVGHKRRWSTIYNDELTSQ
jgi:hypothetical protein